MQCPHTLSEGKFCLFALERLPSSGCADYKETMKIYFIIFLNFHNLIERKYGGQSAALDVHVVYNVTLHKKNVSKNCRGNTEHERGTELACVNKQYAKHCKV